MGIQPRQPLNVISTLAYFITESKALKDNFIRILVESQWINGKNRRRRRKEKERKGGEGEDGD